MVVKDKTKQEEIREGLAKEIAKRDRQWWEKLTDADKEFFLDEAQSNLEYLHDNGVVIKVTGDLSEIKQFTGQTRRILIQAGYVATESLVEG